MGNAFRLSSAEDIKVLFYESVHSFHTVICIYLFFKGADHINLDDY